MLQSTESHSWEGGTFDFYPCLNFLMPHILKSKTRLAQEIGKINWKTKSWNNYPLSINPYFQGDLLKILNSKIFAAPLLHFLRNNNWENH